MRFLTRFKISNLPSPTHHLLTRFFFFFLVEYWQDLNQPWQALFKSFIYHSKHPSHKLIKAPVPLKKPPNITNSQTHIEFLILKQTIHLNLDITSNRIQTSPIMTRAIGNRWTKTHIETHKFQTKHPAKQNPNPSKPETQFEIQTESEGKGRVRTIN